MPVPRSPLGAGSLRRLAAFLGAWPSSWTSGVSARMAVFDFPPTPQGKPGSRGTRYRGRQPTASAIARRARDFLPLLNKVLDTPTFSEYSTLTLRRSRQPNHGFGDRVMGGRVSRAGVIGRLPASSSKPLPKARVTPVQSDVQS